MIGRAAGHVKAARGGDSPGCRRARLLVMFLMVTARELVQAMNHVVHGLRDRERLRETFGNPRTGSCAR